MGLSILGRHQHRRWALELLASWNDPSTQRQTWPRLSPSLRLANLFYAARAHIPPAPVKAL
eukprot:6199311-Pleurochrysis_carterae.AAC.1